MAKKSVIGIPPSRLKRYLERYKKQLDTTRSLVHEMEAACDILQFATTPEEAFALVKELTFHEELILKSVHAMNIVSDALYNILADKLFKDKI